MSPTALFGPVGVAVPVFSVEQVPGRVYPGWGGPGWAGRAIPGYYPASPQDPIFSHI